MTYQQKEINQLYHLSGMTTSQIADKLSITQDDVINMLMTWNNFYQKATKK